MSTSTSCDTGDNNWIERGGLDHTSDMSEEEHGRFIKEFRFFKEQTDFSNEQSPIMLKYYVQMAYLEGWRKSKTKSK